MSDFGDKRSFAPSPMVAPQVVVREGRQPFPHGHYARSGCIHGDSLDSAARYPGPFEGAAQGGCQRRHVIVMTLRGMIGIVLAPVKGILRDRGPEAPAIA